MKYNMILYLFFVMYSVIVSVMGNMLLMFFFDDYNMFLGFMDVFFYVSFFLFSFGMVYMLSVNVMLMYYFFILWFVLSFLVFEFFYCLNVFCWVEIECMFCE